MQALRCCLPICAVLSVCIDNRLYQLLHFQAEAHQIVIRDTEQDVVIGSKVIATVNINMNTFISIAEKNVETKDWKSEEAAEVAEATVDQLKL